jgi:hypothetical protein
MSNFWPGLVAVTLTFLAGAAHACERPLPGQGPVHPAINVRVDNDVFGGQQQDRGYSNGFLFTLMSSNLRDDQDPDCLPAIARGINRCRRAGRHAGRQFLPGQPRVDKRKLVGDLGYGLVVMRGNWKVVTARASFQGNRNGLFSAASR